MKLTLDSETSLELSAAAGALSIESPDGAHDYSPFHMLGSALALCTYAVLAAWAQQAGLDNTDLTLRVRWEHAESPARVGAIGMEIVWPSLPEARREAARRAAAQCSVHHTLEHGTDVSVTVSET